MDVADRLTALDLPTRLTQLGVHADDREGLTAMVEHVRSSTDDQAVVQQLIDQVLLPQIGNYLDYRQHPGFPAETAHHPTGAGALPIVAYLLAADEVHAAHRRRGLPDELSWRSLADFGHQVAKHRWVHGGVGLHNHDWLRNIFCDGFLWLERLEFELSRATINGREQVVLGVHIPDGGPLSPDLVAADFARAADLFRRYYPEAFADPETAPNQYCCYSWLLDPVVQTLVPGSNMAHFQSLWTLVDGAGNGDRDAYYFGFNIEPTPGRDLPYDLDALPTESRLHRAMVAHWRSGGHFTDQQGVIPFPS